MSGKIRYIKVSKKDNNGIYASRVKPKIKELLEVWFPKKKELSKLVIEKGSKNE